ncbi:729_t:CDS:2, partial [Cetraspora pellucida]
EDIPENETDVKKCVEEKRFMILERLLKKLLQAILLKTVEEMKPTLREKLVLARQVIQNKRRKIDSTEEGTVYISSQSH